MYYLGIDLGGTNIAAGVVDSDARLIAKASRKTQVLLGPEGICRQMAEAAGEAMEKAGVSERDVCGIGVGTPGTVERDSGIVRFSSNLNFKDVNLRELMERQTGKPVRVENDANAAAYGEYRAGVLKGAKNAIAITLGTGIGSGILIGGKIYAASNSAGGEFGHTVIAFGGRPCPSGRCGCWETYASATGLILTTKEMMREGSRDSLLWQLADGNLENVNSRMAFTAMRAGDALGKAVVDRYIAHLGCGLVNCINIFQPDILCIGGGVSGEGEALLRPLMEYVDKEANPMNVGNKTLLCLAKLGNDAGIIGAALTGEQEP